MTITELQQRLGHRFGEQALLLRALTHRSFGADHNERLEFLGDAVLSSAISALLFARLQGGDEGDLTRVRATLVREESLHRAALVLGLPALLRLSEGEARGGGAQRASILADAVEALIGAVFVDAGYEAAAAVVLRLFGQHLAGADALSSSKDPKTELQEWLQARRLAVPSYSILAVTGQAHAQTFEVECSVPALSVCERGMGKSRRTAEQDAARRMIAALKAGDPPRSLPLRQ